MCFFKFVLEYTLNYVTYNQAKSGFRLWSVRLVHNVWVKEIISVRGGANGDHVSWIGLITTVDRKVFVSSKPFLSVGI